MTFEIKKRINTELFIDRPADLNREATGITIVANEVDQQVGTS